MGPKKGTLQGSSKEKRPRSYPVSGDKPAASKPTFLESDQDPDPGSENDPDELRSATKLRRNDDADENNLQVILQRRLLAKGVEMSPAGIAYVSACGLSSNSSGAFSRDPLLELSQKSTSSEPIKVSKAATPPMVCVNSDALLDAQISSEIMFEDTEWLKEESLLPSIEPVRTISDKADELVVSQITPARIIMVDHLSSGTVMQDDANTTDLDWKNEYLQLEAKHSKLKKRIAKLKRKVVRIQKEKMETDEYALTISKELRNLKERRNISQVMFLLKKYF
ncbi:uncharacterized protein LOC129739328 isoform X1 [Uranotaenia lowii]|uniref:uncharacterized protein LOC129739328 isoform X1 n=1 Tax=Uranotaenia lowii TaxID=190385 RepID=UPI00247AA472|nr:uncharacterized protein LOC129739328 isoform X1 [Uranotaenia lowii]